MIVGPGCCYTEVLHSGGKQVTLCQAYLYVFIFLAIYVSLSASMASRFPLYSLARNSPGDLMANLGPHSFRNGEEWRRVKSHKFS